VEPEESVNCRFFTSVSNFSCLFHRHPVATERFPRSGTSLMSLVYELQIIVSKCNMDCHVEISFLALTFINVSEHGVEENIWT